MKFRFRWIPFIAAMIAATIGISLGQWQTRRATEKEGIEARLTARQAAAPVTLGMAPQALEDVEFRRMLVKGEFVPSWTIYLDNRPYKGVAGFHVVTPMKIVGSDMHVLVARGWIKRDVSDRTRLPHIATPTGIVALEGVPRRNAGHVLELGNAEPLRPGVIVQNAEIAEFARASGLKMHPFIIEQLSDLQDGLVRDWQKPSTGIDKHRGYAFQWYALAVTAILFFVVTGFRRGTK